MGQIDKDIQEMLKTESPESVLELVKITAREENLTSTTLAELFIAYVNVVGWEDEDEGISSEILLEDLLKINKSFRTTNGNQWARRDTSILGKKYDITINKQKGKTYSVQLTGWNSSVKREQGIRKDILDEIHAQRCVVLDTNCQIEADHKNGRKNDPRVMNKETQLPSDFQPLHKTVNDVKRKHCERCMEENRRYDAKRLGYKEGWTHGDETDLHCIGCYWYDPQDFNKTISQDFIKRD